MSETIGRVPAMWRLGKERLRGPSLSIEIKDGAVILTKGGLRRFVQIEDVEGLWKIMTNDMEFNEMTAERIRERIDVLRQRNDLSSELK